MPKPLLLLVVASFAAAQQQQQLAEEVAPAQQGAAPAEAPASQAAAAPDWAQVALALRSRAEAVQQRVNAVRARLHVHDLPDELEEERPRRQGQQAAPAEPWDSRPLMRRGGHRRDRRRLGQPGATPLDPAGALAPNAPQGEASMRA